MNPEEARRRFANLRAMLRHVSGPRRVLDPTTVLGLHDAESRLLAAIERNRGPGPAKDGYPSGRQGPGGEYAPTSTTETGAFGNYRLPRDVPVEQARGEWVDPPHSQLHIFTTEACEALRQLDEAWKTLDRLLDAIRSHAKEPPRHSNPGGTCIVCGRWVEGTATDRLRRGMCNKDRMAHVRAGQPDLLPQFGDDGKARTAGDGSTLMTWIGRDEKERAA